MGLFVRATKYFGPWEDPEGAEKAYHDYISNQCTKTTRRGKVGDDSEAPKKPRKNYPLWPHPTGQWAKKINGTTYYTLSSSKLRDDPAAKPQAVCSHADRSRYEKIGKISADLNWNSYKWLNKSNLTTPRRPKDESTV